MSFADLPYAGPQRPRRAIAVAVGLSLLVHVLLFIAWRAQPRVLPGEAGQEREAARGPLIVELAPPPRPPVTRAPAVRPAPPVAKPTPPRAPPPAARRAPVPEIRPEPAAPPVATVPAPSAPQPAPAPSPPATDLSAYIDAQRRARGGERSSPVAPDAPTPAPVEDENARANRLATANLAAGRPDAFGYDPNRTGGVFTIKHVAYDYAEFLFYGWNREARRNTAQLIEVRRGGYPDIKLAIIHRMIAIIREHEQGDFVWQSHRLGKRVTLSARPRDTDGLVAFLLEEFFDLYPRPR